MPEMTLDKLISSVRDLILSYFFNAQLALVFLHHLYNLVLARVATSTISPWPLVMYSIIRIEMLASSRSLPDPSPVRLNSDPLCCFAEPQDTPDPRCKVP